MTLLKRLFDRCNGLQGIPFGKEVIPTGERVGLGSGLRLEESKNTDVGGLTRGLRRLVHDRKLLTWHFPLQVVHQSYLHKEEIANDLFSASSVVSLRRPTVFRQACYKYSFFTVFVKKKMHFWPLSKNFFRDRRRPSST